MHESAHRAFLPGLHATAARKTGRPARAARSHSVLLSPDHSQFATRAATPESQRNRSPLWHDHRHRAPRARSHQPEIQIAQAGLQIVAAHALAFEPLAMTGGTSTSSIESK